jgi:hypothetical protein
MLCNYSILVARFHLELAQHVYSQSITGTGRVYWIRVFQLLQICHHRSLPWFCNPSSRTSEEPFRYTSSVIGSFHHASVVHERLYTSLLESIQGLLLFAYMGLFLVYLKTLRLFYICFFFNYSVEKNSLYIHLM